MVMATGIVSDALRLAGLPVPADVLLVVAGAGFAVLLGATCWRAAVLSSALRADLTNPDRAFAAFAFTAACVVLGTGLAAAGLPAAAAVLAVAGALAWIALTLWLPGRVLMSPRARPDIAGVSGTWYLWAVATQSLAIVAADGMTGARPAAAVAVVAWVAGIAIYLAVSVLVVAKIRIARLGAPGTRAAYWVTMGAASISTLAAAGLLRAHGALGAGGRAWVTGAAVALWVLATTLIPVLVIATTAIRLRSGTRPRYRACAWMVVFPLGMYATASIQLGIAAGLPAIRQVGEGLVWVAVAAWAVTFAAMAATPLASRKTRADAGVAGGADWPGAGYGKVTGCP